MQFTKRLRDGVRRGDITCSVRIWTRPHVRRGGRYAMQGGSIEVDSIERIELADVTPALARESGFRSVVDLLKIAKHGPGSNVYLVRFRYLPASAPRIDKVDRGRERGVRKPASGRQRKRVIDIVGRLPEAAAAAQGAHLSLEVRKKRFGWFLDDHHGDGRVALNCKASADTHAMLQDLAPRQYHVPKYLGAKGWVGVWLDVPGVDWAAVELALRDAYRLAAPKALQRKMQ